MSDPGQLVDDDPGEVSNQLTARRARRSTSKALTSSSRPRTTNRADSGRTARLTLAAPRAGGPACEAPWFAWRLSCR